MEHLVFSLNATAPIFLIMVLGYLLRQYTSLMNDEFAGYLNIFVFRVALPAHLFKNMAESDFHSVWDGTVVVFCLVASALSILLALAASLRLRETSLRAEFVQASYRGSQALLGAALMQSLYGGIGSLALGLIGAVPLYNVAAVILLTLLAPGGHLDKRTLRRTVRDIATNPILLGIIVGLVWSLLDLPQPAILEQGVSSLAATATPLGLLALGASVELKKVSECWKGTLICTVFKLVLFVVLFLPLAVWLGLRGEELVVILIVLGSPTAVACFNMARAMGHQGTLSAGAVMLSTVCSAFTLTIWLTLLRMWALI